MNSRKISSVFYLAIGSLALQVATPATADQQILDDLIVDGSICAGFDCVNGESFGFDTLRLKENNLRIRAVDTSSSASFPTNDWQITFNDSSNGGANKFSIDDIDGGRTPFTIEAGAPSHSLYVDDSGRIGLGTSTPVTEIHVKDGDTPTLRLEQDGTSGFTPQTWDLAGNETNFFLRDATNGSTLPLRIRPGAPTSALDIAASGNVGLGTGSPDRELDIEGVGPGMRLTSTGDNANAWDFLVSAGTGNLAIFDDPIGLRRPIKVGRDAANNLLRLGITDPSVVNIAGNLAVAGDITATGSITPDYVFQAGYDLPTIDEHAEFMWKNSHLPKIEAAVETPDGKGLINLGQRSQGLLEELEVAHIYIDQLHNRLADLEKEQEALKASLDTLLSARGE